MQSKSLKRCAETRKLEMELALERKVKKEREAEGEEFSDKEAFFTSAYKKRDHSLRRNYTWKLK